MEELVFICGDIPAFVSQAVCEVVIEKSVNLMDTVIKCFRVINKTNKLRGLSPRANYTDRATAACRRS
jgi:hypothetical protein